VDAREGKGQVRAAATLADSAQRIKCYWYRGPQGMVHGPISSLEMARWSEHGYIVPGLPIRHTANAPFYPLWVMFPPPMVPFRQCPRRLSRGRGGGRVRGFRPVWAQPQGHGEAHVRTISNPVVFFQDQSTRKRLVQIQSCLLV